MIGSWHYLDSGFITRILRLLEPYITPTEAEEVFYKT